MAEGAIGVAVALATTWFARFVHVNPLIRVGQVSGLAALQLVMMVAMGCILALLIPAMRRWRTLPVQFATAAFSGLASGITAAAIVVALRGTPWPLGGQGGDAGVLQGWAFNLIHGQPIDDTYPPLFPHLLAWYTQLVAPGDPGHALKMVSLIFTALLGPVAYLSWRLLLPPLWALGIGVTASLPLADPYKPYTTIVLVGLLPVLAKLLQLIQRSHLLGRRTALLLGAAIGAVLGLLFVLYSGWFVWSAAGLMLLGVVLLVGQWRKHGGRALGTALLLLLSTVAVFLLISGSYLSRFLSSAGSAVDRYCYFDVYTEPSYFAMWGTDAPGALGQGAFPVPGEIGGVGVFVLLLLVGAGVALALGPRHPVVLAAAAAASSAFLMRYWYAAHMEKNQAVMLYPRTSQQLLYCFLVLTGLAAYIGTERCLERRRQAALDGAGGLSARRTPRRYAVATLCSLGLLFAMAGSSTGSKYMPQDGTRIDSTGAFAWSAQHLRSLDGVCSPYVDANSCWKAGKPEVYDQAAKAKLDRDNQAKPEYQKLTCEDTSPFPKAPKPAAARLSSAVAALIAG